LEAKVEKKLSFKEIKPYILSSFDETLILPKEEKNEQKEEGLKKKYEELKKKYEETLKSAYIEGFNKGYEEGLKKAEKEIDQKKQELNRQFEILKKLIDDLSTFKEKQMELFLPQILRFAFKIAEKVVATKISLDRHITLSILKDALAEVPNNEEKFIVKLNPKDYEFILQKLNELGIDPSKIQFEPSENIKSGDYKIETQSLHIVATVEEKLKELENAVNTFISQQE
jgi:flagellar assembly protein FliH